MSSSDRDKARPSQYDVLQFGFNFRFDDIRAALGLAQLKKLPLLNVKGWNGLSDITSGFQSESGPAVRRNARSRRTTSIR